MIPAESTLLLLVAMYVNSSRPVITHNSVPCVKFCDSDKLIDERSICNTYSHTKSENAHHYEKYTIHRMYLCDRLAFLQLHINL